MSDPVIKLADLVAGRTAPVSPAYVMSDEERADIEHALHHYDDNRAASIDALKIVQAKHGWVPDGAIAPIGEILGIPASDVEGVATFYNLIFRRPVGRNMIKICDSISCFLTGYDEVRNAISAKLRINLGQTTPDMRYTLLPICCLGACDKGPVLMINDDTHGNLSPETIPALLEQYL
ncbi:MAG: NADH-quinone oxidoreductase subunit NuoE [Nevskia sp.]